ncbi:hypothetical protein [Flagellimonas allohymeniacidonis]|uniref:Uncharacterized protein n=1 Tax=Flagellimonas allohymeniacidonis TaxID=2517819 RepID=A0A4V2HSX9_9FLAO|nr:hypothetical protein [Allomuricauda hymeniacidonis]TAI49490.1 hypothetical protein EW142_06730 [Allomuricauda hymeniacidonis]
MKNLLSFFSIALLSISVLPAQENSQGTMDATLHKTFTIETDGTQTEYNVKVLEHRKYPVTLSAEDKGKINQDRETSAAKVTKLIAVDTDNDNEHEQYFVLKYRKSLTDTFELVATEKGFAVKVDDKTMQYFAREGIYFINNDDQDFFTVEEFKELR